MNRDAGRTQNDTAHTTAWVVGIVAAVLVYAISPGPIAWWIHHRNGGTEPEWVRWIYAPLIYGCENFEPMGRAYEIFFDWCIN